VALALEGTLDRSQPLTQGSLLLLERS
jgi:hypothetical protein